MSAWSAEGSGYEHRIASALTLNQSVTHVKYVNKAREKQLARLNIFTVKDLLLHAPFRFINLASPQRINQVTIGEEATVIGVVHEVRVKNIRRNLTVIEVALIDDTGLLMVSFFNQPWLVRQIPENSKLMVNGVVSFDYGYRQMKSPFFEVLEVEAQEAENPLLPVHRVTEGLSTAWMRRIIQSALEQFGDAVDNLPLKLRTKHDLLSLSRAINALHFPADMEEHEEARRRCAYHEVLLLELGLMARRNVLTQDVRAIEHQVEGELISKAWDAFPFEFTSDQKKATSDILADMKSDSPMNRILLGDVGTGKTAVATMALVAAAQSGYQAALMAPTSVLAHQYAKSVGAILDKVGVSWRLLTGATSSAERKELLTDLESGDIDVLLGTHALFENDVVFKRLSLVIIDEQHRFGVDQRSRLRSKGPGSDFLSMTATPIPRSLALAIYGDLDSSYLRERPHGTNPPKTHVLNADARGVAYDAIRDAVDAGQQAYVITPLVGLKQPENPDEEEEAIESGSDISDPKAAEKEVEILSNQVFPQYSVAMVTGRMKTEEKDEIMNCFRDGEIDVLVATTVVEVGVDVPNATVMMIENAERFGLSQLHQLRGRVGRGTQGGEVYLVGYTKSPQAQERLDAVARISDGFELSEFDLQMRHEGELLGIRQSGFAGLKFVNLSDDGLLIKNAHADAQTILEGDSLLENDFHSALRLELIDTYGDFAKEVSGG